MSWERDTTRAIVLLYRSVRDGAMADVGRAAAMATGGVLAFAPVEYGLTVWAYPGSIATASKLRLVALATTLSLVLWLVLVIALAGVMVAARLIRHQIDPIGGRRVGWFVASPLHDGVRPGVPRLWAVVMTGLTLVVAIQRSSAWAITHYKEPQLIAAMISGFALVAAAVAAPVFRAFVVATGLGATAVAPVLRAANPLGRWRAAGIALALLVAGGMLAVWTVLPQSRSVLPTRLVGSALVVGLGMGFGALGSAQRWGFRRRVRSPHRKAAALAIASTAWLLMIPTLVWWGADLEAKYAATTASPAFDKLVTLVRVANDLDRDGFGSLLGEGDCAPFDPEIHPGAVDKPDDGIDQNCDGHDFSLAAVITPAGPKVEIPPQFKREWNVLLLTIDATRYDSTTFGGYAQGPKHRDTTPRLAELVKRSTSFTWAQAPSAGTMASIPAILTSKYFHSGIALDETNPPGTPPRIKPENVLLPEIMKRAGYRTGAIGSHVWWNGWGVDQGVDDFDNSIAPTDDPYRVAADRVTDHALAWISRQQGKKWFLWAHYIDPHGRYVAHPDVVDYGSSEPDLYDAELKWTDQQIGRLLDELQRLPSTPNTIIVITSDHGDSMAEHSVPLGTHGTALYRELLHVPLIYYIPDNPPHLIGGAVTNLDIVPTIAELCGIDVHDLSFEGISDVPALFAGREDKNRIVFAETNAPFKQRAAISEKWKLIYYLKTNVYELFDLAVDPWEKTNLAPSAPPAFETMKRALDGWMERVLYARDPLFNQAYHQLADVLVDERPAVRTDGQTLAGGIQITGIGPSVEKPLRAGTTAEIHVYFAVHEPTTTSYKLQLAVWPGSQPEAATTIVRSGTRLTADGAYPTDHWRAGDHVRERFPIAIPASWQGEIVVGLVAVDASSSQRATPTGPASTADSTIAVLGRLALGPAPAAKGGPSP